MRPFSARGVRGEAAAVLLLGLVILVVASLVMPAGFWVLDESCRFLQTVSLSQGLRFPPPVRLASPEVSPVPAHYGYIEDGAVYVQYGPLLALLALPGWLLLGEAGAYLPAAAGGACLLAVMYAALRRNGFGALEAFLLPLAGTPVLFYSTTLWSHTLSAALVAGATVLRKRPVPALIMIGAAALFREEALVMAPVLLAMELHRSPRPWKACLSGVLALVAVFLCGQLILTGSPLGTHIAASGSELDFYGHAGRGLLEARLYVLHLSFLSLLPGVQSWASGSAGLLLWLLWAVSRKGGALRRRLAYAGLAISGAAALLLLLRGATPFDSFVLKHPLVVFPLLWLVPARRTAPFGAALLVLLLAMGPMHAEDMAWGSRLIQLPLFAACLFARPGSTSVRRGVVALGLLTAVASMALLAGRRASSARLRNAAAEAGGSVVTTSWILAGDLMPLTAAGTPVGWADRGQELAEIMDRLRGSHPVLVAELSRSGPSLAVARAAGFRPKMVMSVEVDPRLSAGVFELRPAGTSAR